MSRFVTELLNRYPALESCQKSIYSAYDALSDTFRHGGKLLCCGNGGSSADSGHIVGELMKGFMLKRPPSADFTKGATALAQTSGIKADSTLWGRIQGGLPAISLTAHSELITAFANDIDADLIFAQQVYGYGKPGDALLAISTSGNSRNVALAALAAKQLGLKTVAMAGCGGGKLGLICDVSIKVPADSTPEIQEYHLPVYHCLCMMLEDEFFGGKG